LGAIGDSRAKRIEKNKGGKSFPIGASYKYAEAP